MELVLLVAVLVVALALVFGAGAEDRPHMKRIDASKVPRWDDGAWLSER